jgi:glyoxylase-like metal-dependent hydrolase (beta-lactamase superfamily II)
MSDDPVPFAVTGVLQQRAWQRGTLPPVERVRRGLWSIPVPIPESPLRYVLCYAFEHRAGVVLVDPGWPADESYAALAAGLGSFGRSVADVTGVLVTHAHHDHYGLAARVRAESGAWIAMHERDVATQTFVGDDYAAALLARERWLRRTGAPDLEAVDLAAVRGWALPERPDRNLIDGEHIRIGRFDIEAVWTPGHTPGHMTFHEQTEAVLLSGDHLLPRISPNISMFAETEPNPLDDYLASLAKVSRLPVEEVLPGHEYRFSGAAARAEQIRSHHDERLREILVATQAGEWRSAWLISQNLTWSRSWDDLGTFGQRMAVGETLAHLFSLRERGAVTLTENNGVWLWRLRREARGSTATGRPRRVPLPR